MADEISQELAQRMVAWMRELIEGGSLSLRQDELWKKAKELVSEVSDPDAEIAWGVVADNYDGSSEVAEDIRHNRDGMRDHFSMRELYRHVLAGIAAGRATQ